MKEFKENGSVVEITLENSKVVKASTKYLKNMVANLDIDMEEAVLTWLEDEGYLVNEEQEELVEKSKQNKVKLVATDTTKKKTQKERVVKENPTKELIIQTIANALQNLEITDLKIENKAKLITFSFKNEDFKVDLVQKRKKKEEK